VEKAGVRGFAREDVDLANFMVATSKTLLSPGRVQSAQLSVKGPSSPELFGLFPFALKDISQLDVQDAAQFLEQFVKAQPTGKFAWIAELKPIAQKYLDDCRFYLAWKANPVSKASPAPDLKKQLKTRSAISDAILGKEKTGCTHDSIRAAATAAAADAERIGDGSSEKDAVAGYLEKKAD